jgi:hypothetical protein
MRTVLSFLFICLLSSHLTVAQTYLKYVNTDYHFEIDYPNTLIPQGESDSKDGQTFISADKKVTLWAYADRSHNLIDDATDTNLTFEQYYKREIKSTKKRTVTYKTFSKNFFVVSGTENDKIFYRKTINTENGWFTFELLYATSEKNIYNKACGIIGNSFK